MSSQSNQVPDAWDQDWENVADVYDVKLMEFVRKQSQGSPSAAEPVPEKKLSTRAAKAQRRAEHAEFNRQLWAEAETPQTFHFLESRSTVPIKSEYKAPMKVLARKPQSGGNKSASGLEGGVHGLSIGDNGDDDDDDFERRPGQLTYEERVAKAQKEREEKQRKYEEVRERLFGSSTPGSGNSSPGNVTPPRQGQQQHQGGSEGKRKGRNNRSNTGGNRDGKERRERDNSNASGKASGRLYDPSYAPKANSSYLQRKEKEQTSSERDKELQSPLAQHQTQPQLQPQSPAPQVPIRSPRGPDPSGRGGFGGFPSRGARGG
ncbi:uncharacterized protein GIQ15_04186 [Arthroderma uncinatum]|uniref:uncharacterized protein n=1 Tax=Arthroderma uncinatum TaxID=74035 RepID=UPI00144A7C2F|nr:uncharacterized protein GIQ15_04186 [Arthroderma uncinatum]KAF3481427.1 hypothetical protein GIQ15_04186 [Arthroderma uncinatum]